MTTARTFPRILSLEAADSHTPTPTPAATTPAREPSRDRQPSRRPAPPERHATIIPMGGKPTVVEVWSPEELDRLPEDRRPGMIFAIPGIGYIAFQSPRDAAEVETIRAAAQRASTRMMRERDKR